MPKAENPVKNLILARHAKPNFSKREVSVSIVRELLDLCHFAPCSFNLQPWHFIIVRDDAIKKVLYHITLQQKSVLDAPLTVCFAANPYAWRDEYSKLLEICLKEGTISSELVSNYRKAVNQFFSIGPFGLGGLLKKFLTPLQKIKYPMPRTPCSAQDLRSYVAKQTMLAAAYFMLAAQGAGFDTVSLQGFDEFRLKRLLLIPSYFTVPILIPFGYPLEGVDEPRIVRLPLEDKVSLDLFGNKIKDKHL